LEEGEGGRRSGKAGVADNCRHDGTGFHALKYLSVGAQNSVKKGVHFGTHRSRVSVHASHEALTLRSPVAHPGSHPWLTLLARCECLKRHGVGEREGEVGADFIST
jgi:hypothetical protein